jgi:hypothetical protein
MMLNNNDMNDERMRLLANNSPEIARLYERGLENSEKIFMDGLRFAPEYDGEDMFETRERFKEIFASYSNGGFIKYFLSCKLRKAAIDACLMNEKLAIDMLSLLEKRLPVSDNDLPEYNSWISQTKSILLRNPKKLRSCPLELMQTFEEGGLGLLLETLLSYCNIENGYESKKTKNPPVGDIIEASRKLEDCLLGSKEYIGSGKVYSYEYNGADEDYIESEYCEGSSTSITEQNGLKLSEALRSSQIKKLSFYSLEDIDYLRIDRSWQWGAFEWVDAIFNLGGDKCDKNT